MKCYICADLPSFICSCNNVLICSNHLGQHINSSESAHPYSKLDYFSSEEAMEIKREFNLKLQNIKQMKLNVNQETKKLTQLIEKRSSALISDLDRLTNKYLKIFKLSKIYAKYDKEIEKLLRKTIEYRDIFPRLNEMINDSYTKAIRFKSSGSNCWPIDKKVRFLEEKIGFSGLILDEVRFSNDGEFAFNCMG